MLVTVCVDDADSVTTKAAFVVPPVPSVTVTSAIDSDGSGLSSLVMVPTAVARATVAFTGADSVTVKVSLGSSVASVTIGTVTVCVVDPAGNVSVPLAAV